jgi:hypothetical protein
MQNSSAVISFDCILEDVDRCDFIASGEGELLRTFRCSVEVRKALRQAAIYTHTIESAIDALDEGGSLKIPVTHEQFCAFYHRISADKYRHQGTSEARKAR